MCPHLRIENAVPNCILPLAQLGAVEEKTRKLGRWLLNPREQGKLIVAEITWKRAGNE
jgi:hypothetical protein